MNQVKGYIKSIEVNQHLSKVTVKAGDLDLTCLSLDTPETTDFLEEGVQVNVIFKETEVIMCVDDSPKISLRNRIPGIVKNVEKGSILSKVELDTEIGPIKSIITTNAVRELSLEPGTKATAMIKTNELTLAKSWNGNL